MKKLDVAAATLVLVGGLNWGLVGLAKFDLVAWIFGGMSFGETNAASRIVYGLVGLAAVDRRRPVGAPNRRLRPSRTLGAGLRQRSGSIAPSSPCTDCSVAPTHVWGPAVKNNVRVEPARPSFPNASDQRPLTAIGLWSLPRR